MQSPGGVARSLASFKRAVALSGLGIVSSAEVVQTAVDALMAGLDTPALRDLAGRSKSESYDDLRGAIESALSELGEPLLEPTSEESSLFALEHYCREYLGGRMSGDDLTAWAHQNIGHGGAEVAQPIVMLDDDVDAGVISIDEKPAAVAVEVDRFLRLSDLAD